MSAPTSTRHTVRSRSRRPARLWRDWTLSCAAGEVIGIGVAAGIAFLVGTTIGEPDTPLERVGGVAAMVGAGLLEGLAIGYFQWIVLRRPFPAISRRDWIAVTVAVAMLGWLFGMLPSTLMADGTGGGVAGPAAEPALWQMALLGLAFGVLAGALFGFGQWLVLRRHARNAGTWILGNALGWAGALLWIFIAAGSVPEGTPGPLVVLTGASAGLLAGLTVGVVTGLFLLRLLPFEEQVAAEQGPSGLSTRIK